MTLQLALTTCASGHIYALCGAEAVLPVEFAVEFALGFTCSPVVTLTPVWRSIVFSLALSKVLLDSGDGLAV